MHADKPLTLYILRAGICKSQAPQVSHPCCCCWRSASLVELELPPWLNQNFLPVFPEEDVNPVPLNISVVSVISPSLLTRSPMGTVCPWCQGVCSATVWERVMVRCVAGGNSFGQSNVTSDLNTRCLILSKKMNVFTVREKNQSLGKLFKPSVPHFLSLSLSF